MELVTGMKKKRRVAILSSSEEDDQEQENTVCKDSPKSEAKDKCSLKKCKIVLSPLKQRSNNINRKRKIVTNRFSDSSDEDNETPKTQKWKRNLEKMCKKKRKETRILSSDEEVSSSNEKIEDNPEHRDIKSLLYTEKEEEKLPSFKHEEHPPESEDSEEEHDFINDEEDTEHSTSSSEGAEDGRDESEDSESYVNPYMERNNEMERQDILQILSKSTEKDKNNKRRYKKEMGHYQLAIRKETNPALYTTNKQRYESHMAQARHDKTLKEDRNLEKNDDEFYYNTVLNLLGDKVQVFPHTKRTSRFSSRCALYACNEKFEVYTTEVVGIKRFSDLDMKFRKKPGRNSYREGFYWICASHCPSSVWKDSSCSSSNSDNDEFPTLT